jgi:polyisoprenoid-binding protein YceI
MRHGSFFRNITAVLFLSSLSGAVFAGWQLDSERSSVQFITVKNSAVAESHSFADVSGAIDDVGKVTLSIGLDSVETLIPIRNERIREFLFETADFATADITATVDNTVLETAAAEGVVSQDITITLSLHGVSKTIVVAVILVGSDSGTLLAVTASPILVNAADFALDGGVEKLRELASLKSISTAVPVTFQLQFVPER